MAEHSDSVLVNAPREQVYQLFSHFNDFPKFMSYVKEVTHIDGQRSHWVADIIGHHEWDAINENWMPYQKIGWHSIDGIENSGMVVFDRECEQMTRVTVDIKYDPPAGFIGDVTEALGAGKRFEAALQDDLDHFAEMVQEAPEGALDPESSAYLFHEDSAAVKRQSTPEQDAAMAPGATSEPWTEMPDDTTASGGSSIDGMTAEAEQRVGPRSDEYFDGEPIATNNDDDTPTAF